MKHRKARLYPLALILFMLLVTGGLSAKGKINLEGLTEDLSKDAANCVTCHLKETPGIVAGWAESVMAEANVSCYDCHVVKKDSPMATQCAGIKDTNIYTTPMVSSNTCRKCHPKEVKEFLKSGHAALAGAPLIGNKKLDNLMYNLEGGKFFGNPHGSGMVDASRAMGCQVCHGTQVELGPDKKPLRMTWPGGVGTRYPDGTIGNCTVCHTRHMFSIAEARKPEACGACHLGPDHPDIEIYLSSKHGQMFTAHGDKWEWESPTGEWEPGDYIAPTCATCHMSGIGDLKSTHNINERLKWDMAHKRSEIRTGVRGDGKKGRPLMRQVCKNCHSTMHTDVTMEGLDNSIALYNSYWDRAVAMKKQLAGENLLKADPWKDPFQELTYYLWHHVGRRARHGAAMNGPDYAHWHGFFQMFQIIKDMEDILDYRLTHKKIEPLSPVMSSGPE